MKKNAYIGLDVHKETIAVAVAEDGISKEILFLGNISNAPHCISKMIRKIEDKHNILEVVYEAGPCGYGIYHQLQSMNIPCTVVSPAHIFKRPTDRIKNDRRDAIALARLARAGELTKVWVPDKRHEAMRDLVRARQVFSRDLKMSRQRILSFLLKYDRKYDKKNWTARHGLWLANQKFDHTAQQISFQNYINAMEQIKTRRGEIEQQIRDLLPEWQLGPLVEALQALRGVALIIAVNTIAEIGDLRRFSNPKQLMAFLGLIPGEHSSGATIRQRGITKTGNSGLRSLIYEAAWSYKTTPKIGAHMVLKAPDVSQAIKDIAWKAQLRLNKRYKKLVSQGKKSQVAITAVARELVGFMWAIANEVKIAA